MNRRILFSAYLSAACWASQAQTAVQDSVVAVVTRIEQVVRVSPAVRSTLSEESFPDHLAARPDLQTRVVRSLETALAGRLAVRKVQLRQPPGHWLDYRNVVAPLTIDRNRGKGTYYVGVQQVVQLTTTAADSLGGLVRNFLSTTTVQVQDSTGKTVFSGKQVLPFSTANRSGQMSGVAEVEPDDWARLLETSVAGAMEHPGRRLPAQTLFRPLVDLSQYGFGGARPRFFVMQETERGSFRGGSRDKSIALRQVAGPSQQWRYEQSYSLSEGFLRGEYRTRILLRNETSGAEYDITASSDLTRDSMNVYSKSVSPIRIRCTAQRLLVGDYTMTEKRFEGQLGYDVYTVRAVAPRNTFEVRINDQVKALVQRSGVRNQGSGGRRQDTYLYVSPGESENQSDKILITYLIYQMATELGREFLGY